MSNSRNPQTEDKYIVRFPEGMRDRLKEKAKANNRTLNAEIVARLDASFEATGSLEKQGIETGLEIASLRMEIDRLRNERMQFFQSRASADTTGKLLDVLPAELVSQYGLHLYRSELGRVEQQLEDAQQQFPVLWDQLQKLLSSEVPADVAVRERTSQAVGELQRRIYELKEQAELLKQAISGIHVYREVNGLPEIRNVQRVFSGVRL